MSDVNRQDKGYVSSGRSPAQKSTVLLSPNVIDVSEKKKEKIICKK